MTMGKSFTLVEVLISISIALAVCAILTPIYLSGKWSAQITSSSTILRQLHINAKLYQGDYDGDGRYGNLPTMGLPPTSNATLAMLSPTGKLELPSPCGQNPSWMSEPLAFDYIYRVGRGGQETTEAAELYKENLILFFDVNCDDRKPARIWDPSVRHFGIGIHLGGRIVRKRDFGDMYMDSWWSKPMD